MDQPDTGTVLRLNIQPSGCLKIFFILIHLSSIIAVIYMDIHGLITVLLVAAVLASLWFQLHRYCYMQSDTCIKNADWLANNQWQLTFSNSEKIFADSWDVSLVHPNLILLSFKDALKKAYLLPLCMDSVPSDIHRNLRVRLNMLKPEKA